MKEAAPRLELGIEVLQTSALPLGHAAPLDRQDESTRKYGAGNGIRTRDLNVGNVALYQLSYSRPNAGHGIGVGRAQASQRQSRQAPVSGPFR